MTLTDCDAPPAAAADLPLLDEEPRPVLELAAECVQAGQPVRRGLPHHHDWPAVTERESPYGRFIGWLEGQLDGAGEVDLTEAALDRFLVGDPGPGWPLDCLLRPMRGASQGGAAGPMALLAQCLPAGLMDARFVPALCQLGADVPQAAAYHRFLCDLGERSGACPVEVLAPPLSRQAANAVRRPAYTGVWTGDQAIGGYFHPDGLKPDVYLPLSEITLRRQGSAVVAEAGGQRIWPVSHTTRVVPAPWDTIHGLLMLASPQPERDRWRGLTYSLPAFPGRDYVPRITVGGGLVLSAAQWRVPQARLWHHRDSTLAKAAALLRIRRTLGLPRWVSVTGDVHDEGRVVDLDSLQSLRVLDRVTAGRPSDLLVTEFLPGPGPASGAGRVRRRRTRLRRGAAAAVPRVGYESFRLCAGRRAGPPRASRSAPTLRWEVITHERKQPPDYDAEAR